MSIEMQCTGCGQTLRVSDEHAGKKARCPGCGMITQVPASDMLAETEPMPQGERPAGAPTSPVNAYADRPAGENPYQSPNVQSSPSFPTRPFHRYARPHRGGLILTLGILGLLCCWPTGVVAWILGTMDLDQIRKGQMDPSGKVLTQVGMVLGIISTVLAILGVLVSVVANMT